MIFRAVVNSSNGCTVTSIWSRFQLCIQMIILRLGSTHCFTLVLGELSRQWCTVQMYSTCSILLLLAYYKQCIIINELNLNDISCKLFRGWIFIPDASHSGLIYSSSSAMQCTALSLIDGHLLHNYRRV